MNSMSTVDDGRSKALSVRFPIYLLTPVPLGLLGMFGMLIHPFNRMLRGDPSEFDILELFLSGPLLGCGGMGILSWGFAAAMRWMERRSVSRVVRYAVASALGALCGATLGLIAVIVGLGTGYSGIFFGALGASVGLAVAALGDLFAFSSRYRWWFRVPGLLAAAVIPSVGASAGQWVEARCVAAAREAVLADVVVAMTCDEVERAAGAPDRTDRKVLSRPAAQGDMVWTYMRRDPGSRGRMDIIISFRNGKVFEVHRYARTD